MKTAKPKSRKEKFGRYVITIARRISERGVFTGEYITDIRGNFLCEALSEFYHDVDGVNFPKNVSLDTEEMKLLFHARSDLAQKLEKVKAASGDNTSEIFELEAGLEFIGAQFGWVIEELKQLPENEITFEHLWTLYCPNTLLYGTDQLKQGRIYRVRSSGYKEEQDRSRKFILTVDYLDSDGEQTGFVNDIAITIEDFEGSTEITDLRSFPLSFHPQRHEVRQAFIKRGDKLLRLKGRHLQGYSGHALLTDKAEKLKKFNVSALYDKHWHINYDANNFSPMVGSCWIQSSSTSCSQTISLSRGFPDQCGEKF